MTTMTPVSVESIAKTLVEKCRQSDFEAVVKEFYSPQIVSIESMESPNSPKEIKGIEAVIEKSQKWAENTEVHSMQVSDPLVAGAHFVVRFSMDMTCKQTNQRFQMDELALYQVENGKIVRAEFIYDTCD